MVLIRNIKIGFILVLLALAGSCDEYIGPTVDCSECFWEKPDSASLIMYFTIDEQYPEVPFVLYRGNVEEGQVDLVDTARESTWKVYSAVDQFYSVAAEYKKDGKVIHAIDGDAMKVKHVTDACDFECWIISGGYLEAELKFD